MSASFASIVAEKQFSLAEAFLAFARAEYPALDAGAYLERLDAMGQGASRYLEGSDEPSARLEALGAYLSSRGFGGNHEEYYDPRNSFLNEVLDRRVGIPITLSVVWIETGARAGLDLDAIGMPMHFLVGLPAWPVYADPFNDGRILGADDAILLFGEITQGRVEWRDDFLQPASRRDVVRRALSNLKAVYGASGDMARALWVEDHLLTVPGADPAERRERASVLAALGRYPEAIRDLRTYLDSEPEDAQGTEQEIRRLVAAMN